MSANITAEERRSMAHWKPLEQLVGKRGAADFMFMDCIMHAGKRLYLYKHINTRRYLNINEDGECFKYVADPAFSAPYYDRIGRDAAKLHAIA